VAKKRGAGEGSIYKHADGRWVGQVVIGFDAEGKIRRRTVSARTRAEVAEKPQRAVKPTPRPTPKKTAAPKVTQGKEAIQKPEVIAKADPAPRSEAGAKRPPTRLREQQNKYNPEPAVAMPEPKTTPRPPNGLNTEALYEKARSFHTIKTPRPIRSSVERPKSTEHLINMLEPEL